MKRSEIKRRNELNSELLNEQKVKFFGEIIDDILGEVRSSAPPLPDYSIKEVRKS
jgi:hypothetical protein